MGNLNVTTGRSGDRDRFVLPFQEVADFGDEVRLVVGNDNLVGPANVEADFQAVHRASVAEVSGAIDRAVVESDTFGRVVGARALEEVEAGVEVGGGDARVEVGQVDGGGLAVFGAGQDKFLFLGVDGCGAYQGRKCVVGHAVEGGEP